jgi:alpha-L-fucosidase
MRRSLLLLLLQITWAGTVSAQQNYVPAPENLKNRAEFQDMKFGVFIHWGIYSMMADGEWIMNNKNINWQEYAKLADGFYPSKFDAKKWVADVESCRRKVHLYHLPPSRRLLHVPYPAIVIQHC